MSLYATGLYYNNKGDDRMLSLPEIKKKQIVFVLAYEGDKLSFSNDNIIVKDKEGVIKHQSTCYKLFMVIIAGNISITSGILQRAKRFGFSICLMTRTMKVYQIINASGEGNTLLRKHQYEYFGLELGKHITINKMNNQIKALKQTRARSIFDAETKNNILSYIDRIRDVDAINEIMGYEGAAARIYFERMFSNVAWNGRQPRVKSDFVNSTLDIGYNILFNYMDALLTTFGFDTYYGVLHRCFYRRKSLVCDLVEPFRPLIDLSVRKGINLNQICENDFEIINHKYVLSWKKSPKYASVLMAPIVKNKSAIFSYLQKYYRAFMKQSNVDGFPEYDLEALNDYS